MRDTKPNSAPAPAEPQSPASRKIFLVFVCVAVVAIFAAYANHFHNSFHFDDAHTVVNNVYIRNLHNIPRFFTDATTFSSLPANQTWRPIVSLSLAIDYKLGRGLNPLWFHISTFFWFLVQLWLMYLLYRYLMDAAAPRAANRYIALFAVLWYGLHPAIAETVNYIIQRADLYATLGVVAGMVIYIRFPALRKFGIYLLPVILGAMSKATAVVFGGILLVYIFLFEEDGQWNRWWPAILRSLPALAVSGNSRRDEHQIDVEDLPAFDHAFSDVLGHAALRADEVRAIALPAAVAERRYRYESLHGIYRSSRHRGNFVLPRAYSPWPSGAIKRRELRPIAFGIFWYFGASAPTSLFVLSEVENDHRMFFPFVGLMLSATWAAALGIYKWLERSPEKRAAILRAVQVITTLILVGYALGTWKRNQVWRNEDSLFYDVTIKSPQNGRGLMNYGLTKLEKGDTKSALDYFTRATQFTPNYPILEINLGIAYGVLNQIPEAESHFRRAEQLAPEDAQPHYFYGRWLAAQGRTQEAIAELKSSIAKNPPWMDPRSLLMQIYFQQGDGPDLKQLAQDTLQIAPGDAPRSVIWPAAPICATRFPPPNISPSREPTADNYLNLSLVYHQAKRYQDSITAARKAIQLKPNYPEAYNNIAADYEDLHQWDPAIEAAKQALKLRPDFQLAKNNLAWSESQKKLNVH